MKNYDQYVELTHNPNWIYFLDRHYNLHYWWFGITKS